MTMFQQTHFYRHLGSSSMTTYEHTLHEGRDLLTRDNLGPSKWQMNFIKIKIVKSILVVLLNA